MANVGGKGKTSILKLRYAGLICEDIENNPCRLCNKRRTCTQYCEDGELWFRKVWKSEIKALFANAAACEKRIIKKAPCARAEARELKIERIVRNLQFRDEKLEKLEAAKGEEAVR